MKSLATAVALPFLILLVQVSWPAMMPVQAMPADQQKPNNPGSVRIGREVAKTYCSKCHAIGRTGRSPNPKAPVFPLVAERYPNNNPAPDLVDGIVVRHPGMPEFRLTEDETDGLVAYLRNISRTYRRTSPR